MKIWGFQWKSGISNENLESISDENLGVSNEKIWVSNKNLWVCNETSMGVSSSNTNAEDFFPDYLLSHGFNFTLV